MLDQGKVVFDIQHHITISSQFDLFMNKKDSGVVEGYGDDYIFKNTSNLSGTSADGTDFNFIVPIVEE